MDDVVWNVDTLEKERREIHLLLKDLKEGHHSSALEAAIDWHDLNTRLSEFIIQLTTLDAKSDGLRRDLEKLPSEFEIARILIFVVGGLGATAALLKLGLPFLDKMFG